LKISEPKLRLGSAGGRAKTEPLFRPPRLPPSARLALPARPKQCVGGKRKRKACPVVNAKRSTTGGRFQVFPCLAGRQVWRQILLYFSKFYLFFQNNKQ